MLITAFISILLSGKGVLHAPIMQCDMSWFSTYGTFRPRRGRLCGVSRRRCFICRVWGSASSRLHTESVQLVLVIIQSYGTERARIRTKFVLIRYTSGKGQAIVDEWKDTLSVATITTRCWATEPWTQSKKLNSKFYFFTWFNSDLYLTTPQPDMQPVGTINVKCPDPHR